MGVDLPLLPTKPCVFPAGSLFHGPARSFAGTSVEGRTGATCCIACGPDIELVGMIVMMITLWCLILGLW